MANQTANRECNRQEGRQLQLKSTNAHFYRGAAVVFNGTNDYVVKAGDTSGAQTAGVVAGEVDHTNDVAGDTSTRVEVYREGIFHFAYTGTAPKPGQKVCWSDDQTVALASVTTNDVLAGVVVEVDTTNSVCRVDISVAVKAGI